MAACSSEQELKATEVLLFTRNRYKTHMSHLRVLSLRMVRKECSRRIGGCGANLQVFEVFSGLFALMPPCHCSDA